MVEQPIAEVPYSTTQVQTSSQRQPEIPALETFGLLVKHRLLVGAITACTVCAAGVLAFVLPPVYKAEASILPPQQAQSSLAAFASGALGGLAGAGGLGASLGLKNPADLYIGILKSRTIAEVIINRFDLRRVYNSRLMSDARKELSKNTSFLAGKESIITISVSDHDPKRAASLANAFVDELYQQNSRLALTDASQKRLFFGQRLEQEKDALAQAEIALKATQQATGLLIPGGQAEVLIRSGAELRAQIASRQVQLHAMRAYATEENPQLRILQREVAALQSELSQVESNTSSSKLEVTGGRLPQATLDYIRKLRDVRYHETLFELLAKQFEAARLDEAKQAPVIQVVDRAVTPDKKSGPSRLLIIISSLIAGLIVGSGFVILIDRARKLGPYLAHISEPPSLTSSICALSEQVSK